MTARSDIVPDDEKPIFAKLTEIRQRLSIIKKDHSKFMDTKEITQIYNNVLDLTDELKNIRSLNSTSIQLLNNHDLTNKVDVLIDEIFQLLSLCFVTCGLSNTAPATYASLSTVQRLLEHLNESSIYTPHDLKPIKDRLDEISIIIKSNNISNNTEIDLLNNKLIICYNEYNFMMEKISNLSIDVKNLMDDLLSIKYKLFELITENINDSNKINQLSNNLINCKIKAELIFSNNENEKGSGIIKGLIDNCSNYLNDLQLGIDRVDSHLSKIYENLLNLKSILENLLLTKRWTLRTTDIFNYQKQLIQIDNSRINGYFINKDYKGQSVLLYLLRSCFAIIYKLLESSEPVSESLQPIHNQLSTIRRCLLDLKRMGGISSIRELYPYQLKLDSIDNMKVDGKFMIKGQIPEGQATVTALLAECFDIVHELKIEYYDREDESNDDNEENSTSNNKKFNIIGTKASQDTNYDYNHDEKSSSQNSSIDKDHHHQQQQQQPQQQQQKSPQQQQSQKQQQQQQQSQKQQQQINETSEPRSITKDLGTLDYHDSEDNLPSYANSRNDNDTDDNLPSYANSVYDSEADD